MTFSARANTGFEIPSYQRPYSWTDKEVGELLDDLIEALKQSDVENYFLGSVILVKAPGLPRSEVIDGQQRLTTLTILFSVVRDLLSETAKRSHVDEFVTAEKDPMKAGSTGKVRLQVREKDRPGFAKHIQNTGATAKGVDIKALKGNVRRFAENAIVLRKRLSKMEEDELSDLVTFLRDNCWLVVVEVVDASSARRIFQVLNARGLDLSPTDILKAELLDHLPDDGQDEAAAQWDAWEESVGRSSYAQLFAHIRMMHAREKPRTALEDGFAKDVGDFPDKPQQFLTATLEPVVSAYTTLVDRAKTETLYGEKVASLMASLRRVDNADWWPPVLQFVQKYGDRSDFIAIFESFLERFERLTYYLFVTRQRVGDRIAASARVLDAMDKEEPEDIVKANVLMVGLKRQVEMIRVLDGDLYRMSRVCRPVLLRLDEYLSDNAASYGSTVSVEHVLPQTPSKTWTQTFTAEEREEWTHRVGNLVLLTRNKNTQANNKSFDDKKTGYFAGKNGATSFVLTQEVVKHSSWDVPSLEQRQWQSLERFATIWKLEKGLESFMQNQ